MLPLIICILLYVYAYIMIKMKKIVRQKSYWFVLKYFMMTCTTCMNDAYGYVVNGFISPVSVCIL